MLNRYPTIPYRPLVAFIYGANNECHDRLIERIRLITLRDFPQFKSDDCLQHEHALFWPTAGIGKNIDHRYSDLVYAIARKLESTQASEEGVITAISKNPAKTMCFRHTISLWHATDAILVKRAVELWNSICSRITATRLFIFFCFKYDPTTWKPFWSKEHPKAVKRFIEQFDFNEYRHIHGTVFEALEPIRRELLDEYSETYRDSIPGSKEGFDRFLTDLYRNAKKKELPMLELGLAIEEYIEKHFHGTAVNNRS